MDEQKQKIIDGANEFVKYIVAGMPQLDANGNVRYYFSGSLAMLLLYSAKSIKSFYLDDSGKSVKQTHQFSIPDKNRESLVAGIRQLNSDVDIVPIDKMVLKPLADRQHCNMATVAKNCPLISDLSTKLLKCCTTMYFDCLNEDRVFMGHDVAEITLQDGEKIFIADPLCLIIHKLADAITALTIIKDMSIKGSLKPDAKLRLQKKYQPKLKDFVPMFNCLASLYNVDYKEFVEHIAETYQETAFTNVLETKYIDIIERFREEAKEQVEEEYRPLLDKFIDAILDQNMKMQELLVKPQ